MNLLSQPSLSPRLLRFCRRSAAGLVLSFALGVSVAETPRTPEVSSVITNVGEFWNVSEADRRKAHAVRMEMLVYFYDAEWKLLFGETGEAASFVPVQGRPMAMRAGQRVLLEGTAVPAEGLDGSALRVTVLEGGQMPAALPAAGRMDDPALHGRWVEVEGYVLDQIEPDATHIQASMWSEGRILNLTLQIAATEPVPQLTGARIRVRGVYDVARDLQGGIQKIEFWSGDRAGLKVLGWMSEDERFKLPRTPIDQLEEASDRPWVRLVGEVKSFEPGTGLVLRDDTGQIEISTRQLGAPAPGTNVEIFGRPAPSALGWTLEEALFRRASAVAPGGAPRLGPGQAPVRLRLAEQVTQLAPEEADRRQPVTLRGVITWYDANSSHFYLQDISGGVTVSRLPGVELGFGTSVVVTGVTTRGLLRPGVEARDLTTAGPLAPPPARRISLEQALAGDEEGRWVEMRGYVRQVSASEGWTRLDLVAATGEFSAYLAPDASLDSLRGAIIRLRGVCEAQPAAAGSAAEVRLWVQNREAITTETPPPEDTFAVPLSTVAELRALSAAQLLQQRVRLQGSVLLHEAGRFLYFQDDSGGLFALSRETAHLEPGTRVEIAGLPGRLGSRVVLRETRWRTGTAGNPPDAMPLAAGAEVNPAADARLVRLEAVLRQVVAEAGRAKLSLQAEDTIFEATLHAANGWPAPQPGSRLEVTGVYVLEFDEYRQPHGFRLELRTPADIRLLSAPPWWDLRRALYAIGVLGLAAALAVAWIIALRRRVRAQTEQIRVQLEKEARLQTELERSSRLESLGVLAGGIAHDFNNLLTAVLGNLGLASMDKRVMEAAGDCIAEAERGARRARDITQQLLTFAKGGDPVRTAVPLPEIVTEAANFARHGTNVRFDFDLPSNLPPGNVDAGQISRVVHNLVINAVQAMPDGGVVSIGLSAAEVQAGEVDTLAPGSYLVLTIADTGGGIPPEVLSRIFDPYFSTKPKEGNSGLGLATVRSIVKKHQGHIAVESQSGRGTRFRIWLPAAPPEMPAPASLASSAAAHLPARILVMDDEEVIRRVAGRMLALAGHETVFAADGAEAVRAYAAARQAGRPFDLVIFDLTVPGGMGGKDALQELLRLDPDIRAIASSGYSSDPIMANPAAYGFKVSLPKPYDIPDLMRALEEARRG